MTATIPAVTKPGKFPAWMQKRLQALPVNSLGITFYGRRSSWSMSGGSADRWLDHFGTYVAEDGAEVFVSEPYGLTGDAALQAAAFAREAGAWLDISPESLHYPGSTIRLTFTDARPWETPVRRKQSSKVKRDAEWRAFLVSSGLVPA